MAIIMSPNSPLYTPIDSDDLFDSLTGELIYSPRKSIYFYSSSEAEREYIRIRKLQKAFSSLHGRIKINKPPPPSPDFLPNAYYRSPPDDLNVYSDFEDFIQKNMNRYRL